ncbi:MAG: ABC transporter substrate-binding protein, partial [Planctomycetota bacterium]
EWRPETVLVLAGPLDSARIAKALRRTGARFVFGPQAGRRAFLEELRSRDPLAAPDAASGAAVALGSAPPPIRGSFPVLWDPASAGEKARAFASRYRARFGREPDYAAAYAYDAVQLVAAAVERAGLHRVRIRAALRELAPLAGVTGTIEWDPAARRTGVSVAMQALEE